MTEQDKTEIRQIIREELNARFTVTFPAAFGCIHEWVTDYTTTVPMTRCRKCGQMQNQFNLIGAPVTISSEHPASAGND